VGTRRKDTETASKKKKEITIKGKEGKRRENKNRDVA